MTSINQLKDLSPSLAMDLASEIWPPEKVFERHGVNTADMVRLMTAPWFVEMVEDARREWTSLKNSKQRVRLKGQLALEESIPTLYGMINDIDLPAQARVAAFKELKDLSGVALGAVEPMTGMAGLPSVTIYLGSPDGPSVTIEGAKSTKTIEEAEEIPILEGLDILDRTGDSE
jgi:hypothetical protein